LAVRPTDRAARERVQCRPRKKEKGTRRTNGITFIGAMACARNPFAARPPLRSTPLHPQPQHTHAPWPPAIIIISQPYYTRTHPGRTDYTAAAVTAEVYDRTTRPFTSPEHCRRRRRRRRLSVYNTYVRTHTHTVSVSVLYVLYYMYGTWRVRRFFSFFSSVREVRAIVRETETDDRTVEENGIG